MARAIAWYLATLVLAISCLSSSTRRTVALSVDSRTLGTLFLVRSTIVSSSSSVCNHLSNWSRELGLSRPVRAMASAVIRALKMLSHSMAALTNSRSTITPLFIMR